MILDSGTTDIIVPLNDLKAIYAMLPTLIPAAVPTYGCSLDETTTSPAYTGTNRIKCTCIAGTTFPAPVAGNDVATAANIAAYFNGNVGGVRRFPDLTVKLGSV